MDERGGGWEWRSAQLQRSGGQAVERAGEAWSWILSPEQSFEGASALASTILLPLPWVDQFLASDVSESHPVKLVGFA